MTTYFMFGTYTREGIDGINSKRTERADAIIQGFGGKLRSIHALLGEYDVVVIADLPGVHEAIQSSVEISKETGISFSTSAAIPVVDFDRLITD